MSETSGIQSTLGSSALSNAGSSAQALKDDFLKLLVAQMRFQDPMNPLSGADFTAQLAQFSSLEQLQNIGGKLGESVEADMLLARSINNTLAATLIGKSVRAVDDRVSFDGATPVEVNYNLASRASLVTAEIVNTDGQTVRSLSNANVESGDGKLTWDGRDANGNRVPEGNYTVRFTAASPGDGTPVAIQPIIVGTVSGVRFVNGNPVLLVDGQEIPFGSVLEVLEGSSAPGNQSPNYLTGLLPGSWQ